MTNKRFEDVISEQIAHSVAVLDAKNNEYNGQTVNRFHSFEIAANLENKTMKQALAGMMAKHTVSIYDMCDKGEFSLEKWTEKITDHINYLLLLKAMIVEEKEEANE